MKKTSNSIVFKDETTYKGIVYLKDINQAFGKSYPEGTIVIVKNGNTNDAYTLLKGVNASQTIATAETAAMGGGGDIIQADPYKIRIDSGTQYAESKWESYQFLHKVYSSENDNLSLTEGPHSYYLAVKGNNGEADLSLIGSDPTNGANVSFWGTNPDGSVYTGLYIKASGIEAYNYDISKITEPQSIITKEYLEQAHDSVIIPPTTDPQVAGAIWNDGGTLKVSMAGGASPP